VTVWAGYATRIEKLIVGCSQFTYMTYAS